MTRRPNAKPACPLCKAPADPAYRPFCSDRCAQVDLHRWFSGAYAIPGGGEPAQASREAPDDDEA